jgi:hypothetical protein
MLECDSHKSWEHSYRHMAGYARVLERELAAALPAAPVATLEVSHPDRRAERLDVAARIAVGLRDFSPEATARMALAYADALIATVDGPFTEVPPVVGHEG